MVMDHHINPEPSGAFKKAETWSSVLSNIAAIFHSKTECKK